MHAHLLPGESLLPGTEEATRRLFEDPRVEAVLVPLVPQGEGVLARAARRYLAAWDARFLHRQNFFAPATRVLARRPLGGARNGELAPALARILDEGRFVEALTSGGGVAAPVADSVGAWVAWARDEGSAWGALAAREPRFAPFLPVLTRGAWWRHNVAQAPSRTVEALQAFRRPEGLPLLLHVTREAAFTGACREAASPRR